MKKIIAALLTLTLIGGCAMSNDETTTPAVTPESIDIMMNEAPAVYGGERSGESGFGVSRSGANITESAPEENHEQWRDDILEGSVSAEKIVFTADVTVETLEFDETVLMAESMAREAGGYIESSSVEGKNLADSRHSLRTARFSIRVPAAAFNGFNENLQGLGNIVSKNTGAENVSLQFFDNQAKLRTYQTEEERLFSMLEKCETVEEMLAIESRLSSVRYEIESLTTTLMKLQNRVSYSTINLFIKEEIEYTAPVVPAVGFGEKLWETVVNSFDNLGILLKNLALFIAAVFPFLIIPGLIAGVFFYLRRRNKRNNPNKRQRLPKNAPTPSADSSDNMDSQNKP